MSKMGRVMLDLDELGYDRCLEIELKCLKLREDIEDEWQVNRIIQVCYNLHEHTTIMITGGAKEHKCSQMLRDNDDYRC